MRCPDRVHGPGPEAEQVPDDPELLFRRPLATAGGSGKTLAILEEADW